MSTPTPTKKHVVNDVPTLVELIKTNMASRLGYLNHLQRSYVLDDLNHAITDALVTNLQNALDNATLKVHTKFPDRRAHRKEREINDG